MTTITIVPERADSYRAVAGDKESTGRTAGEALDRLTAQFADEERGAFVVMLKDRDDEFFSAAQQQRLAELMQQRQAGSLPATEARELESLIETELDGTRERTEALLNELKP